MAPLHAMFDHHAWATLRLIDHCATLPAERLDETVPGTYGSILDTLVHLVAADRRYLERITGAPQTPQVREGERPTLEQLRTVFETHPARWAELIDVASSGGRLEGRFPADLMFLQAIHHGNDHRTHVCTILGGIGLDAPDLDGWTYWSETRPS